MPIVSILQAGQRVPNYIFFYVILLGVFYFILIRPQQVQQRKRRAMLGKLKKGDRVVTAGGLHAMIHDVDEETLTLELAPNLRVKADRSAVSYVRGRKPETITSPVSESGPPRP